MSELLPLSTRASIAQYSFETEGFALHLVDGDGERTFRSRLSFEAVFTAPPLVHVALAGFDIDHCDSVRLRVHVESITASGFDVVLTTWAGTKVYAAAVSWLAIGQSVA